MKIILDPTDEFATVRGASARKWQGATATGFPVVAFIVGVAFEEAAHRSEIPELLAEIPAELTAPPYDAPLEL
jgi:hypothetical protein